MNKTGIRKRMREIEALGWSVGITKGRHLKCTHPDTTATVFTSLTPSDHRNWENLKHDLARALRDGRS